jgi:hypothetical protein
VGGAREATSTHFEKEDDTWDKDPENPLNWGPRTKFIQIAMLSSATFLGFEVSHHSLLSTPPGLKYLSNMGVS